MRACGFLAPPSFFHPARRTRGWPTQEDVASILRDVLLVALSAHGESIGTATAQVIKEHITEYDDADLVEKGEMIRFCRLSKLYDQSKRRFTMCWGPGQEAVRRAVLKAMVEKGWERKQGRAPPSFMERELQAWLEVLLKE